MKKIGMILSLLCSVFVIEAQIVNYETKSESEAMYRRDNAYRKRIKENHIASVKMYRYKYNSKGLAGKGYMESERKFDAQGECIEFKWYNKHGKLKDSDRDKWDDKGKVVEETYFKPDGKMRWGLKYAYDTKENQIYSCLFLKRESNIYWHSEGKYDTMQNILELNYLDYKNRSFNKYVYLYNPDGTKKQTLEYNKKGKVEHTWDYNCNPVGKLIVKNIKDTSKICIRYELDKDGNEVKISESNVKEGRVIRIIRKFDKNDNIIDMVGYDIKGGQRYHYSWTYNEKKYITQYVEYERNTNNIGKKYLYNYDIAGNLTDYTCYKKAIPDFQAKFNYSQGQ